MTHTNPDDDTESIVPTKRARSPERVASRLSRRRVLSAGALSLLASLAGCFDGGGAGTATPAGKTTPPSDSVFEEFSFDVRGDRFAATGRLAVQLQSEHGLDQVNLIAPDGSLFTSAQVATGATTVHLQMLEVGSGIVSHYSPGEHTLVAIKGDDQVESMAVELQPFLEIVSVAPHRTKNGDQERFVGDVAIRIENRGAAPTWVYDFDLPEAPNPATSSSPGPDTFFLQQPTDVRETIILPGDTQTFVPGSGDIRSFQLHTSDLSQDEDPCTGRTVTTPVIIHTPVGAVSQEVEAQFTGEASHRFTDGEKYVCTETAFVVQGEGGIPNA